MPFVIVALTLFAVLMAAEADAKTDDERLVKKFSPILMLTEDTGRKWGDIIVTKPKPMNIMGATSAENLRFRVFSSAIGAKVGNIDSYLNWDPPLVNQLGNPKGSFFQNQTAPMDSLMVKEMRSPFDIENEGLRFLAKVAAGTASGVFFGAMSWVLLSEAFRDDPYEDIILDGRLFFGTLYVGSWVGFPIGVSSVDPHDSLGKTLLGSGVAGLGVLGLVRAIDIMRSTDLSRLEFIAPFVVPPIISVAISEKSRKPPQAQRVSFGLSPTLNGGLSAVAQLRF